MDKITKYRVMESVTMLLHPGEYETAAAAQAAIDDENNLDLETDATCYQVCKLEYDDPTMTRAKWEADAMKRKVAATPTPDLERKIAEAKALLATVEAQGGVSKIIDERLAAEVRDNNT